MIKFQEGEIFDIIPTNFQTHEMAAISYAVKHAMESLIAYSKTSPVYGAIEEQPEAVLDLMAVEMRVQYFDQSMPMEVKRKLISQAMSWYMRAGTPVVIKEFLETLYDGGEISEWFEYDGEPYYFKVKVFINEGMVTEKNTREIREQIEEYKNKRSWLELLIYAMTFCFLVSVRYAQRLTVNSNFFSRGNIARLYLDGSWRLDGKYALNGLKGNLETDFHPVTIGIWSDVTADVHGEAGVVVTDRLMCRLEQRTGLFGIMSDVDASGRLGGRVTVQGQVSVLSRCNSFLTEEINLWYIDGTHKLGESKKLNAEIRFHDL